MEQRLGRGLDSLITRTLQANGQSATQDLLLSEIRTNPSQPRKHIEDEGLAGLAASISTHGVLQPIVVRRVEGGYEIVAGERRFRAAHMAGRDRIAATIIDADGIRSLELAIVENIQRENLSALDEAAAYQQLILNRGLTHQELAERVGKSRATVTNALRLLELPEPVRNLLQAGSLSAGQARALLGSGEKESMGRLAEAAVSNQWTVREVEDQVRMERPTGDPRKRKSRKLKSGGKESAVKNKSHYEDELRAKYGTRVIIQDSGGRGDVRLAFYSAVDRDRLLSLLLAKPLDRLKPDRSETGLQFDQDNV